MTLCRHLDVETHEVIKQLMGAAKLRSLQEKTEQEEEEQDMWEYRQAKALV